jgi:3-hydroxyacyl-CoA dehydrogenase/enoyl-CoA hydratase/3-hydroxybutyryl-CoA epimerase
MHYFTPVPRMPLLEVVTTAKTSKAAKALAVEAGAAQGKTVIVVADGPGFYTSRVLVPFMDEAVRCLLQGHDVTEIDGALQAWGFAAGPFAMLDEIGLDIASHASRSTAAFFAPRFDIGALGLLDDLLGAGFIGKKRGRGFFVHGGGGPRRPRPVVNPQVGTITAARRPVAQRERKDGRRPLDALRLVLRLVNEAVQCLEDGVLQSPSDGDVGAVLGLGFPAGTGGPFRYVDREGASRVVGALERLAEACGGRFKASALLVDHAKTGRLFHPGG